VIREKTGKRRKILKNQQGKMEELEWRSKIFSSMVIRI
jgi:hypothetical protein